jgi:hypothetical protein
MIAFKRFDFQIGAVLVLLATSVAWPQSSTAPALRPPPIRMEPAPQVTDDPAAKYPPLLPSTQPDDLGKGVQRTMQLLASSTPAHRNHVRVLFYGQSITEQEWSKAVGADLRKRFPEADFDIQNRAIGGFASQILVNSSEIDLYPFYPDLVIFHVYGANQEYEQIIQRIRSRTTAEVLMQTDHATSWPVDHAQAQAHHGAWWDDFMNNTFLPETAAKYGCGLVDVRKDWLVYLRTYHIEPKALTIDGTHLNAQGNYLMSHIISRYLVPRKDSANPPDADMVRTMPVAQEQWNQGRLKFEFDGNRIDAIAPSNAQGQADVLVDGQAPSAIDGCYCFTRPSPGPWSPLFIMRVDHHTRLQVEEWTCRVTSVDADGKSWQFAVSGSITGDDGTGSSDKLFVSNSGRVVIDPKWQFRGFKPPLPVGFTEKWTARLMGVDHYQPPADASSPGCENTITLAQGLKNGHHVLELNSHGPAEKLLQAFRVYRPPVQEP